MIQKVLIVFIFLTVSDTRACAQEDSTRLTMHAIDTLYNTGSYRTAELEARRLLEYSTLNDSVRVAVHKIHCILSDRPGEIGIGKRTFHVDASSCTRLRSGPHIHFSQNSCCF